TVQIRTFLNERSEQGTGDMEQRRLGMTYRHQVSVQSCGNNWGAGEISGFYAQGDTLYASGNAVRNFNSTKDFCKDNINNNRLSEMQEPSANNQLYKRYSVPDAGLSIVRERNKVDSVRIQEIWMGDQREQEQVEAGVTVCVPGIDVQLNNNENLINQRQDERVESTSSKTDKANNGIKTEKDQKLGKFGWQDQVFHSTYRQ
ncbi:MAG: hypothetical protein EZS28_055434, partial [Streblomastix strix]